MSEKESPEHSPAPATPQSDSAVPSSPGPEVLTSPVSLQVPAAQSLPLPTVQNIDQPSILPPVQSPPRPPDVFIPKDLSYDGLMYFAAWLQDQGKITNEQFNYLHKTAQQYRKTQEELNQSYQRMDAARRALDIPGGVLPPQPTGPPAPSQAEQLVNLMTALAAASQQPKEEPHSYLIRKGDQSEIEEMKAREEAARKPGVVSTSGTLAAGPISREEMERQRRERYEQLQRSNEEAARRKEEAERRARALDAMWRNDGSSSIGKP